MRQNHEKRKEPWHESSEHFRGKEWFLRARAYGIRNGFVNIVRGTPEHVAWRDYFKGLGWTPYMFQQNKNWTAPSRWPQQFTAGD